LDSSPVDGVEEFFPGGDRDVLFVFWSPGGSLAWWRKVKRSEKINVRVTEVE